MALPSPTTYGQLMLRHPGYQPEEWAKYEALYAGGQRLFGNPIVLDQLLHRHNAEDDAVYAERKRTAFYIAYAGQLIDKIVAALFGESLTFKLDGLDPFYAEFIANIAGPEAEKASIRQHLRRQITTALVKGQAWTLLELPAPIEASTDDLAIKSLADEEQAGLRDVYGCAIEPECVRRWSVDAKGQLDWSLLWSQDTLPRTLTETGDLVRETFTYYDRVQWRRWSFEYKRDKTPSNETKLVDIPAPPGVDQIVDGTHSFGRVPLLRLELPEGLYAMGKLARLATEHFNESCARSWGLRKGMFQFLAFMLAPGLPGDGKPDGKRHINQKVGPGRAWKGIQGDEIKVIAPDVAPFAEARASLSELRDEMARVVHQMSQSVDNSSGSLGRSGLSKAMDKGDEAVVLAALGTICREHAVDTLQLAARGRRDHAEITEEMAHGMDAYDDIAISDLLTQEALLETIPISSHSFQADRKKRIAHLWMGNDVGDDRHQLYDEELDASITAESVMPVDLNAALDPNDPEADHPTKADQPAKPKA